MAKKVKSDWWKPYKHIKTEFKMSQVALYPTKGRFKSDFKDALHPSVDLDELWEVLQAELVKRGLKDKPKKKDEERPSSSSEVSES